MDVQRITELAQGIKEVKVDILAIEHQLLAARNRLLTLQKELVVEANGGVIPTTVRQQSVLLLLHSGLGNKEIASALNISERTVKFHVSALLRKFQCKSRRELVALTAARSSGHGTAKDNSRIAS